MDLNFILIGFVFLGFGFVMSFVAKKFINVTVFVILLYVGMILIEELGMSPSWLLLGKLQGSLFESGKMTIELFIDLLDGAPIFFTGLFFLGGIFGLFMSQRYR